MFFCFIKLVGGSLVLISDITRTRPRADAVSNDVIAISNVALKNSFFLICLKSWDGEAENDCLIYNRKDSNIKNMCNVQYPTASFENWGSLEGQGAIPLARLHGNAPTLPHRHSTTGKNKLRTLSGCWILFHNIYTTAGRSLFSLRGDVFQRGFCATAEFLSG